MEMNGYKYLLSNVSSLPEGSIIIRSDMAFPYPVNDALLASLRWVETKTYNTKFPVRIMNREAKAGLYSYGWGYLPYSFSFAPLDHIDIFRVSKTSYFLLHLSDASMKTPIKGFSPVAVNIYRIDERAMVGLFEHPPTEISYRVHIPDNALLSFNIGINPEVWHKSMGDGVEFKIDITPVNGGRVCVFDKYIDPKHNINDRKWFNERVDLRKYANKDIIITFITLPGPAGDTRWDWAIWGEPEILNK